MVIILLYYKIYKIILNAVLAMLLNYGLTLLLIREKSIDD